MCEVQSQKKNPAKEDRKFLFFFFCRPFFLFFHFLCSLQVVVVVCLEEFHLKLGDGA